MHRDVLGRLQAVQHFGIDLIREIFLGDQFDLFAQVTDIEGRVVTVDHEARALRVNGAAGNDQRVAAREFREDFDVFRHIAHRCAGRILVGSDVLRANGNDAYREFRLAGGEHQRVQTMRHEVAQQPAAVRIIFPPAEIVVGIERHFFLHCAEPTIPIDVVLTAFRINRVIPFALRVVAAIVTLPPNELADLARLDHFARLVPRHRGATLRPDLQNLSGALHRIGHLECFAEITRHGFLHIHVLARIHRVHGALGMPDVVGGDHHCIDVFALDQFPMVAKHLHVVAGAVLLDERFRAVAALLPNVADRDLHNVVFARVRLHLLHVRHALATHADITDNDPVVRAVHLARRGRGVLPVNRRVQDVGARHRSGRSGGGLDKCPA